MISAVGIDRDHIVSLNGVNYVKPFYSNSAVDKAAEQLLSSIRGTADYQSALDIINQWRSSHLWPLEKVRHTLKNRANTVDKNAVVVQRLKRLASIENKLTRLEGTRLSGMQDIGGCRAIVKNVDCVDRLVGIYDLARERKGRSVLISTPRDYITHPQATGYRGVHLIIKYQSESAATMAWNGRKIEIQLRTKLQHAWATSLETVSTLLRQLLKAGIGDPQWLRFFALAGGVFAVRENCPPVPGLPEGDVLYQETLKLWHDLNVRSVLFGCSVVGHEHAGDFAGMSLFVLQLNAAEREVTITGYRQNQVLLATNDYNRLEEQFSRQSEVDIVLVKADDVKQLKLGYPNYYADTDSFVKILQEELESRLEIDL